jgi:hypothetical protein
LRSSFSKRLGEQKKFLLVNGNLTVKRKSLDGSNELHVALKATTIPNVSKKFLLVYSNLTVKRKSLDGSN